jgi:hypothetical protein
LLTWIPEEVLDRLSSIFTICYILVNHFIGGIPWVLTWIPEEALDRLSSIFTIWYTSKPFYPVVYQGCSPKYQRRSWTGFLPSSPYGTPVNHCILWYIMGAHLDTRGGSG